MTSISANPTRFLLDTCFVSDLAKPGAPASLVSWGAAHEDKEYALSVVTLGEIQYGIELLPGGHRRDQLTSWLERELIEQFKGRILDVDADIAHAWGAVSARARTNSRRLLTADGLLLATAMVHSLAVVTRNVRHFSGYDVHVINPWESAQA